MHPLLLVPPALVVALALDQGGFDPSAWVWSGALAAWAAATVAVASRELRVSRRQRGVARVRVRSPRLGGAVVALVRSPRPDRARTAAHRRLRGRGARAGRARPARHDAHLLVADPRGDRRGGRLRARALPHGDAHSRRIRGCAARAAARVCECARRARGDRSRARRRPHRARRRPTGARGDRGDGSPCWRRRCRSRRAEVRSLRSERASPSSSSVQTTPRRSSAPRSSSHPARPRRQVAAALSRLSDGSGTPRAHAAWIVGVVTIACAAGTALAAATRRAAPGSSHRRVPRLAVAAALVIGAVAAAAATGSTEPRASLWRRRLAPVRVARRSGLGRRHVRARLGAVGARRDTRRRARRAFALLRDARGARARRARPPGHVPRAAARAAEAATRDRRRSPPAHTSSSSSTPGSTGTGRCPPSCSQGSAAARPPCRAARIRRRAVAPRGRAAIVVLALALGAALDRGRAQLVGARCGASTASPGRAWCPRCRASSPSSCFPCPCPFRACFAAGWVEQGGSVSPCLRCAFSALDETVISAPRVLPRVRAMADLHAVLLARRAVLAA